jgi:hypothetical protein
MDRVKVSSLLWLALMISGCATILDGSNQTVTINSQPNGAKILINGMQVGVTPLTTQVKRSKTTIIGAKKDGYQEQQVALQTKTNTYFWLNILFGGGGVFSSTTDYASDAMIEYSPNMYFITLEPIQFSQTSPSDSTDNRRVRNPLMADSTETKRKTRSFLLRNYAHLTSDIAKGSGEYLMSLYVMLGIDQDEYGRTLKKLKLMVARHREPLAFTDAVLEQFGSENGFPSQMAQGQRSSAMGSAQADTRSKNSPCVETERGMVCREASKWSGN